MPPIRAEHGLIRALYEIGPVIPGGMAMVPIDDTHIDAWQRNAGHRLTPWQARMLRRLSKEFAAEQRRAEDPAAEAPWATAPSFDRDIVGKQISIAFKALAQAQKR